MKNKDDLNKSSVETSLSTIIIITVASLLSTIVIIAFFGLAWSKDLLSLSLNEIGDSFAGFAGFLAFLWLIVTVLLQTSELRLQRNEVSGLKSASEDQAKSLNASLQVQTLTFLDKRQKEVEKYLISRRQDISETVTRFLKAHIEMKHAYEFKNSPHQGIPWILGFFLKKDTPSNIELTSVDKSTIKSDFAYEAYLELSNIINAIDDSWNICKPLFRDAKAYGHEIDFEAWIAKLDLVWYRDMYVQISHFHTVLREVVKEGNIASTIATHFISAFDEMEAGKELEVPFSSEVIQETSSL